MAGDLFRLLCNRQTIALPSLCQVGDSELVLVRALTLFEIIADSIPRSYGLVSRCSGLESRLSPDRQR